MKKTLYPLILLTALLAASCNHEEGIPSWVMDEETMTSFLKEAYLLEGFYAVETQYQYDTLNAEMAAAYDSLLARHHLTRQDFDTSIAWYSYHPDRYEAIHDEVIAYLDSLTPPEAGS